MLQPGYDSFGVATSSLAGQRTRIFTMRAGAPQVELVYQTAAQCKTRCSPHVQAAANQEGYTPATIPGQYLEGTWTPKQCHCRSLTPSSWQTQMPRLYCHRIYSIPSTTNCSSSEYAASALPVVHLPHRARSGRKHQRLVRHPRSNRARLEVDNIYRVT